MCWKWRWILLPKQYKIIITISEKKILTLILKILVKNCVVNSVSISPCPAAETNAACRLAKAKNYDLEFDFTPSVAADDIKQNIYWIKSARQALPWSDFGLNGCDFTACPAKKDEVNKYKASIPIDTKYKTVSTYKKFIKQVICLD